MAVFRENQYFSSILTKEYPPSPYFTFIHGTGNIRSNIKGENFKKMHISYKSCLKKNGQSKDHLALGRGCVREKIQQISINYTVNVL